MTQSDQSKITRLEKVIKGYQAELKDVEQALGKALKYPKYVDDLKIFPDATKEDGVCIGTHSAATIAEETAEYINVYQEEIKRLKEELVMKESTIQGLKISLDRERATDWKNEYEWIRKVHLENTRKLIEFRMFKADNFSIKELEKALARKRLTEKVEKENTELEMVPVEDNPVPYLLSKWSYTQMRLKGYLIYRPKSKKNTE